MGGGMQGFDGAANGRKDAEKRKKEACFLGQAPLVLS